MKTMKVRSKRKTAARIGMIPAKEAGDKIHAILNTVGIRPTVLASACLMAEPQLVRLSRRPPGAVRVETLIPLERVEKLVHEASETLTEQGARNWLNAPNPYLDNMPPILRARSDAELDKALSALASIRYGFPA